MKDKEYGVKLVADTKNFENNIKKASQQVKKFEAGLNSEKQALKDLQDIIQNKKDWTMGFREILALPEEKRKQYFTSSPKAIEQYSTLMNKPAEHFPEKFLKSMKIFDDKEFSELAQKVKEEWEPIYEERKKLHDLENRASSKAIDKHNQEIQAIKEKTDLEIKAIHQRYEEELAEKKKVLMSGIGETTVEENKDTISDIGEKENIEDKLNLIGELVDKYTELLGQYANVVYAEGEGSESANNLKEEIKGVKDEIEQETESLEPVVKALSDLEDKEEEAGEKGFNLIAIFENFGDSVKKGVNSIKRFSLSLLGIQSIYSALSKATHAYMAQDDSMHNQMQANWIALGAIMAPIIEKLINLFTKLVGYVNLFVKTLTLGKVDLIAKAMDTVKKKSEKTRNAVKSVNQELATFDEITNLNFDQGGGGIGDENDALLNAFNNLNNMALDPNIVKVIEGVAIALRKVWEWLTSLTDIWDAFKLKIEGAKKQLEGFWHVLHGLFTGDKEEAKKGVGEILEGIKLEIEGNQKLWDTIRDKLVTAIKIALQLVYDEIKEWINNKIRELFEGKFNEIGIKIGKMLGNQIIAFINSALWLIESSVNGFFSSINLAIKAINTIPGVEIKEIKQITIPKIPPLAKGNVAYGPTLAEFGEYSGANTNPEITAPQNMMRETLFEALSDALPLINQSGSQDNRDIVLNVNGREFARATYGDYQTEARRVGSSNVAIRRS